MIQNKFESQLKEIVPENGFDLIGIDYLSDPNGQIYPIEHFEMYQDALKAKKIEKIQTSILFYTKVQMGNV